MEIEIRLARDEDRDAIAAIGREVVDAGEDFVFLELDDVLDYWFAEGASVFVASVDGEVAGTYVVKPNQKGRGAHVANAGYMVAQRFRGRGVGRAVGEHSIRIAHELGFEAMQFNMVVATNEAAVRLWKRLGFTIVGTLPSVFRHPEHGKVDAHVMHLHLLDVRDCD